MILVWFSVFIGYIFLAFVAGKMASDRNRFGFGWFLLSLFISPLFTILALYMFGSVDSSPEYTHIDEHLRPNEAMYPNLLRSKDGKRLKVCIKCGKENEFTASQCKSCAEYL